MMTNLALIGGLLTRVIIDAGRPAATQFLDLFHRPQPERQCAARARSRAVEEFRKRTKYGPIQPRNPAGGMHSTQFLNLLCALAPLRETFMATRQPSSSG